MPVISVCRGNRATARPGERDTPGTLVGNPSHGQQGCLLKTLVHAVITTDSERIGTRREGPGHGRCSMTHRPCRAGGAGPRRRQAAFLVQCYQRGAILVVTS